MVNTHKKCDALKLLMEYRPTLWRKSALEAVSGHNSKSHSACVEQIKLTRELIESLKSDERLGVKLYWVIFATFMTDKQPLDIDEILAVIDAKYEHIPRRTYFRLKKRAIEMLGNRMTEMAKHSFHEKIAI